MGTIAEKLEYLLDTKTAIKNAIIAKGVPVENNATFRSYAESIGNIQSGGESEVVVEPKGVNFFDYDGTLLHSYTVEEAQALQELPPLPEQDGLVCQGWNWSLADIKAHNRDVNVGATYITDDGKTRIYITLSNEDELEFSLKLYQTKANIATVDWGDGSAPSSYSNVSSSFYAVHTYNSVGDYCIEIDVKSGGVLRFSGSSKFSGVCKETNFVRRIHLGSNVELNSYSFVGCTSLSSITIPNSVTSIGNNVFRYCRVLLNITIPSSITLIDSNVFSYCTSLSNITIPSSVTSIGYGAFYYCMSLSNITIPNSVTSIGNSAFYYCMSLLNITIPNGVTSIGSSVFHYCTSLLNITIPNSVTSIGSSAFYGSVFLLSITIPDSVTSIGNYCFSAFYNCAEYHFNSINPPQLGGTYCFQTVLSNAIFYVPMESVNAYKTAAIWSTYADRIVGE